MPVNNSPCIAAVAVNAFSLKVEHSYQFTMIFEFGPLKRLGCIYVLVQCYKCLQRAATEL